MDGVSLARALVLESPRELISRELPLPAIGDDDGLLRVEACGLCGTDHEEFTGELFPGYPFVPGHESVGVVEQIAKLCLRPKRRAGFSQRGREPIYRANCEQSSHRSGLK